MGFRKSIKLGHRGVSTGGMARRSTQAGQAAPGLLYYLIIWAVLAIALAVVFAIAQVEGALMVAMVVAAALVWVKRHAAGSARPSQVRETSRMSGPAEFVIVDLETTGFSPEKNEIIEIGAIRASLGQVSAARADFATFQALVKPSGKVPKRITDLTGITQAMVDADGVPLNEALAQLQAFVGDLPLVAYNAKFDAGFLRAAMSRAGRPFSNEWICALEMAREAWPGLESYKLSALAAHVDVGPAHRALADCQRTLVVYAGALQQT